MYRLGSAFVVLLVLLGGCATGSRVVRSGERTEGYAAPAPDLVGTWRGTAFAVPGSLYGISSPVDLTIHPDGSWSWSKRGQEQARGRLEMRGDRAFLHEDRAKEGAQTIQLMRRGDHLWGLSGAFVPEFPSAVDLRKVAS